MRHTLLKIAIHVCYCFFLCVSEDKPILSTSATCKPMINHCFGPATAARLPSPSAPRCRADGHVVVWVVLVMRDRREVGGCRRAYPSYWAHPPPDDRGGRPGGAFFPPPSLPPSRSCISEEKTNLYLSETRRWLVRNQLIDRLGKEMKICKCSVMSSFSPVLFVLRHQMSVPFLRARSRPRDTDSISLPTNLSLSFRRC